VKPNSDSIDERCDEIDPGGNLGDASGVVGHHQNTRFVFWPNNWITNKFVGFDPTPLCPTVLLAYCRFHRSCVLFYTSMPYPGNINVGLRAAGGYWEDENIPLLDSPAEGQRPSGF
jgi:hypothetical protein